MPRKLLKRAPMFLALMFSFILSQSMIAQTQYCVPEGTNDTRFINNFTTSGGSENISNLDSGFSTGGYGDFTSLTVKQVQSNPVSFSADITGGTAGFRIWVDWNQDNVFDAVEEVAYQSTAYASSQAGTFTVPVDALPGETRMRIVSHWLSSSGDVEPCATLFTYGEFEDYTFEVVALEECSEAIAGTVVGDLQMMVCGNSPFNLSVTGNSEAAVGLTRTWQSSPMGENNWTDLNLSASTITISGISTATDFRYHVECVNGATDDSEVISVTLNPNPDECYCTPGGTNSNYYTNNFSTSGGIDNISNLNSGFSANGYGDFYDTQTVSQMPDEEVSFTADVMGGTSGFRIWVDWNQDGSFDTIEEVAYSSTGYANTHTGSFTVPSGALEGETRMRIVNSYIGSTGDVDPCNAAFTYGEFEDYKFEVIFPNACSGTPDAGTAMVNPTSGNPGTSYTVSASGYTGATGLTFQWQSNTDGAGWVDAGAATDVNTPYSATAPTELGMEVEWRLALTCTNGGDTAYSETATFTTVLTYCAATSTSVEPITRVVFAGIDNASPAATTSPGYEDFTAIVAEVELGETYNFIGEGNTAGNYKAYFTVWIDWNHNGQLEETEKYEVPGFIEDSDGTDGQQVTVDIAVPADAVSGETRMRVRKRYNTLSLDPCGSYSFGQTEDYTVNVAGGTGGEFPSPYCDIADSAEVIVEEITKVEFGDTVITNTDSNSVLIDETDTVVDVMMGETYTLVVEGNTYGNFESNIVAFIDWNQNDVLNDEGEVYELGTLENSTGSDGTSVSMEIMVPAGATLGETRIRITKTYFDEDSAASVNPCAIEFFPFGQGPYAGYGQAIDFTLNVEEGSGGSYCVGEGVEFGDDGGIVNFSTTDGITNIDNLGIENPTGYHDFTEMVISQAAGESFTFTADIAEGGFGDAGIAIYIDYNNDFEFDLELPERAFTTSQIGFVTTITATITIPADTDPGDYRFRVVSDNMTSGPSPCDALSSIHDYTLTVTEGGSSDLDCAQGDDSNGFENGFNITADGLFRNADDFIVSPENSLNILSIELNVLAMQPLTSFDLNFYNDASGAPGSTVVESVVGVVPYAQVPIGSAFGFTVYSVFLEVDLTFEGGTTGATYWMQPVANGGTAYWEISSVGTLGEPIHTSEGGAAWLADLDGSDGVFKLHCDVAEVPPTECMFDITSSVEPITRLVMANVDNSSSASSTVALEDFTSVMIMAEAGGTYDVALEGTTDGPYTNYFTIFINTGGEDEWSTFETFEIGSITASTGSDGQQATSTITLPTSLSEGEYLMRVVKNFNSSPLSPCASYSYGQGEDYTLVIGELEDCSGTPDGGIASVNPATGNTNSTYTVTATGYSFGNGLTYQWQSNSDGAGWVNEGALEDHYVSYTATAPSENGVVVEWRLEVTCTISSETAYSEIATFTTAASMNYCTPELDCTDNDMITNVTFQEINNTTTCSANGYGDYTAMSATVQSGGTYAISVSVGDGWANESVSVWIDFDNSGTFDEGEFYYIGTGSAEALTGEISVGSDVTDGSYRMRVRVAAVGETTATWDMACDESQGYGETEDYTVTVDGTVGTTDNSVTQFTYYPNPMGDVLNIAANKNIVMVSANNVLGQQVLGMNQYNNGKVDVSSLPTGAYLFQVTFEDGQIENFKVLKK